MPWSATKKASRQAARKRKPEEHFANIASTHSEKSEIINII